MLAYSRARRACRGRDWPRGRPPPRGQGAGHDQGCRGPWRCARRARSRDARRGACCGQFEHARSEGGEHPAVGGHGRVEGIEGIEVGDHVRVGTGVVLREGGVAGTDAEEEAAGEAGLEAGDGGADVRGCRRPDAHDAAGHGDARGGGQQPLEPRGEAGVVATRGPQRLVAEPFELPGHVERRFVRHLPRPAPPHTDPTQIHEVDRSGKTPTRSGRAAPKRNMVAADRRG